VSEALTGAGLSLVGDAQDQPVWVEERLVGIMDGCGAFAAVLPLRRNKPNDEPHNIEVRAT
jgi:hypothetical protein